MRSAWRTFSRARPNTRARVAQQNIASCGCCFVGTHTTRSAFPRGWTTKGHVPCASTRFSRNGIYERMKLTMRSSRSTSRLPLALLSHICYSALQDPTVGLGDRQTIMVASAVPTKDASYGRNQERTGEEPYGLGPADLSSGTVGAFGTVSDLTVNRQVVFNPWG